MNAPSNIIYIIPEGLDFLADASDAKPRSEHMDEG